MPRLAWVCLSPGLRPPTELAGVSLEPFNSVQSLLDHNAICNVVVLDGEPEAVGQAALSLRRHPVYQLPLVFTSRPGNTWCAALTDGELPGDGEAIRATWQQWHERLGLFNRGQPPQRLDHTILCWLWIRPSGAVLPVRDPRSAEVYCYPLIEAIAGDESLSGYGWLQQKRQENLLEAGELIDRIRQCTACNSSRLNYVDVCPECHGLDIVRQPSLHCFVCGHVAPQQDFLKGDALVCPNCLSQLRHIGSDYDRPLENYRCRSCGAFFVDADVDVHCIDCSHVNRPDDLRIREIRRFRLSETGRLACRQGLEDNGMAASYFKRLKLMGESDFVDALNWQMAIAKRYGGASSGTIASVLGMRLENLERLLGEAGEARATAMLDSLMERLQQVIRDTDRCMRGREDVLWMLLPQTPAGGLDRLQQRLQDGLERIHSGSGPGLNLRFVGCVLPDQIQGDEDGALLLARLGGDLR